MKTTKILAVASLSILCSVTAFAQNSETTKEKATPVQEEQHDHIKTETFKVYGNCEMCKKRIEKAANSVDGVKSATWDADTKMLTVQYDEHELAKKGKSMDNVNMKIVEAGYDTEYYTADDKAYNALPSCCHYERKKQEPEHKHDDGHNHKH